MADVYLGISVNAHGLVAAASAAATILRALEGKHLNQPALVDKEVAEAAILLAREVLVAIERKAEGGSRKRYTYTDPESEPEQQGNAPD